MTGIEQDTVNLLLESVMLAFVHAYNPFLFFSLFFFFVCVCVCARAG